MSALKWKRPLRVAIDVDGVCANFNSPFFSLLQQHSRHILNWPWSGPEPDEWDWYPRTGAEPEAVTAAWDQIDQDGGEWWTRLPLHADFTREVREKVDWLCRFHEVYFVTHRKYAKNATEYWLRQKLSTTYGISVVCARKSKSPILMGLQPDIIIEDSWANLFDYAALKPKGQLLLVDRPYNRLGTHERIQRVANTGEALERIHV